MPAPNNICSHLLLRLLHIFTSYDIKEQNKNQQATLLAHFGQIPN